MPYTSTQMHRGSGATIRCLLVVIGANQGDGGVGDGPGVCRDDRDGSGESSRPVGALLKVVKWSGALCGVVLCGIILAAMSVLAVHIHGFRYQATSEPAQTPPLLL